MTIEDAKGSHTHEDAKKKIQDYRDQEDQERKLFSSGGDVWKPEDIGCPLTPVSDHIVIKKEGAVGQVGRIVLPDRTAERSRPNRGTVLQIGQEVSLQPSLKVGDTIVYHEYGEVKFSFSGVDFVAIREKDVICIIHLQGEETGDLF